MQFLSDGDKKAISGAIEEVERSTSGEVVFAVSDASGDYQGATFQGALVGAVIATAVYMGLPIPHTIGVLLWVQCVAFAVSWVAAARLPVRRWFVPRRERESRVHEAALMEFYRSGLYKTREANGVLIYLSLLERHVIVLGDKGIHERIGSGAWDQLKETIVRGIRAGRARDGILEAVGMCGTALRTHFPYQSDDRNELSNDVIDRTRRD